jgi:hypothetical protein
MTDPSVHADSRRQFLGTSALSLAPLALKSLLASSAAASPTPHTRPKARSVIFLSMIGGPSQIDLFDPKSELQKRDGQPLPESILKELQFAQIQKDDPKNLMGCPWKFARHGEAGTHISELLPHTASIVDQISFVRNLRTDDSNHMFAELLINTGWRQFGRPSLGSWAVYGLGSENANLPAFMVLRSGMRPRSKGANYGNGFLPSQFQGTPLRDSGDPILNLATPNGFTDQRQRRSVNAINQLNQLRYEATGDEEIVARIASYETAFRMQTSAPELLDLSQETQNTLSEYGIDNPGHNSYARNCLLARRMVERGVRFVQVFHGDWDHHTGLATGLPHQCRLTDQPSATLIRDLARRGLLDETLVIWGGELGRTPIAQLPKKKNQAVGRDHQIEAFTMWFAGGGTKAGASIGETNDFGCLPVDGSWHVHDLQATILHLLGMDHKRLTYRHQGRDFRLTDVHGNIINDLLL